MNRRAADERRRAGAPQRKQAPQAKARRTGTPRRAGKPRRRLNTALCAVIALLALGGAVLLGVGRSRRAQTAEPAHAFVDLSPWSLLLVNTTHAVPDGYDAALTLVAPDPNSQQLVDARIQPALQELFAGAQEAGYTLYLRSGYRSFDTQTYLFNTMQQDYLSQGYSEEEARALTAKLRNIPGYSEHQTGLAADLLPLRLSDASLVETLENEPEMQWLAAHCAEYGFILRYPKEKTDVTGTAYEPWHFRYVGVEDAAKMVESGLTLEEYLGAA